MPNYTEEDINSTIDAVLDGQSLRSAAKNYGVPRQTLSDRILGRQTHQDASEDHQRLSKASENRIADYILKQEAAGLPFTHAQVRMLA